MKFRFREENNLEQRKSEAEKIRNKYPDRIPVVVERVPNSQIQEIDKRKFLVPNDISVAQFMWIIRKRIQLPSEKAIFLFVNKTIPQSSSTMGQIYTNFRDEDGFLYIAYSGENTFGQEEQDKDEQ
jgi:GABA(A) receptor-associated protein